MVQHGEKSDGSPFSRWCYGNRELKDVQDNQPNTLLLTGERSQTREHHEETESKNNFKNQKMRAACLMYEEVRAVPRLREEHYFQPLISPQATAGGAFPGHHGEGRRGAAGLQLGRLQTRVVTASSEGGSWHSHGETDGIAREAGKGIRGA